jgi:hypothetical protein
MPVLAWIVIGAATVLSLSVVVSLSVAAILGRISREVSQLLEIEPCAWAPRKRTKAMAART